MRLATLLLWFAPIPALAGSISAPGVIAGPDSGAATVNPAAVHYNPAALAPATGFRALADVQLASVRIEATATRNGGIDPNTGEPYNLAQARALVPVGIVAASWQAIPDRLTFGLGITDAFVGGGDYTHGETDPTPPYTSHQRYHIVDTAIITATATAAVGVTTIEGLHLGAGFQYTLDSISVLRASDPLGTEGIPASQLGQEVPDDPYSDDIILDGKASGAHPGFNAGLLFDRFDLFRVGVSYASGGKYQTTGEATVDAPETWGGVVVPAKFGVSMPLPAVLRANIDSQITEAVNLGLGWEYQLWNVCCGGPEGDIKLDITNEQGEPLGPNDGLGLTISDEIYSPRRLWNSSNFIFLGGAQLSDKLWLGWRTNYNQYAVPDYAVTPTNLDFANVGGMVAARYQVAGPLALQLAYSKFFLFSREITDSAWNLGDGNERFSPEYPFLTSGNGTYSGNVDVFGLRLALRL